MAVSELHRAAADGRLQDVERLLQEGADVTMVDADLRTPLHAACQQGRVDVSALLLREGAPVDVRDAQGNTPLWRATFGNDAQPELVRMLLEAGADPDSANNAGRSPRHMASTFAKPGVVELFR